MYLGRNRDMVITAKDIQTGYEITGSAKTVTEERVYAFSGGFPRGLDWPKRTIHTDLEFAKSCGLTKRMASGAMSEGYLAELMIDSLGEDWLRTGRMSLKFIAPVAIGDTLVPKAVVTSRCEENAGIKVTLDVWCVNQRGKKVVVGEALCVVREIEP